MKVFRSIILVFAGFAVSGFAVSAYGQATAHGPSVDGRAVTLSLEQCLELAQENDPALRNAQLDVLAAKAQKQEALSEYFPTVSANAFGFYAFNPMLEMAMSDILGGNEMIYNMATFYGLNTNFSFLKKGISASLSATQPIFAGGRIYNGNRLAALGVEAAGLQSDIQRRSSGEEVEQGYWRIVSLEEKLVYLAEVESLLDTLCNDVLAAVDAGVVTETDLLQVQLKRNELKSNKIQLRNGVRLAKMNLFNKIGLKYNPYSSIPNDSIPHIDDIRLTDGLEVPDSPAAYYRPESEVAANQEEMKLLDLSVESKKLEKRMAMGEALPQLAVGVSYGYSDILSAGSMNGAVYGVLKIPISDWGKTSRKMKRIDYQMQKSENERVYLQEQLVLQIHKLWLDLTAAFEKWQVAEESVATVEAVERQMHEHYLAGMSTISELLQAQTSLAEAKSLALDSQIEYRIALQAYLNRL